MRPQYRVAEVVAVAAAALDQPPAVFVTPVRNRAAAPVERARGIAMWLAHRAAGHSLMHIGRRMAAHHTTVLAAVRRFDRLRLDDLETDAELSALACLLPLGPAAAREWCEGRRRALAVVEATAAQVARQMRARAIRDPAGELARLGGPGPSDRPAAGGGDARADAA